MPWLDACTGVAAHFAIADNACISNLNPGHLAVSGCVRGGMECCD
jgi:hypothetical protein